MGYAPASGEIVGILKQMKDTRTMDVKDLAEAVDVKGLTAAEEKAKTGLKELAEEVMKAKAAQVKALKQEIEVNLKADLVY